MFGSFYILHLNYHQAHLICFYGMLLSNRHNISPLKRRVFNHALSGDLEHCSLTMTVRISALKCVRKEGAQPPRTLPHQCISVVTLVDPTDHQLLLWKQAIFCGSMLSALLCLESATWSNLEPLSPFNQVISDSHHGMSSFPHTEWQLGW